jgi:hypothetical protein
VDSCSKRQQNPFYDASRLDPASTEHIATKPVYNRRTPNDSGRLKPNVVVRGPIFPEPVQIIVAVPMGTSVKIIGKGLKTNQVHEPVLSHEQLAQLESGTKSGRMGTCSLRCTTATGIPNR